MAKEFYTILAILQTNQRRYHFKFTKESQSRMSSSLILQLNPPLPPLKSSAAPCHWLLYIRVLRVISQYQLNYKSLKIG